MTWPVLVTGLWHETNSFSAIATDLAAFEAYQLVEGEAMEAAFAGTNTEIGGMVGAAGAAGLELRFGLFAGAVPAGLVTGEAYGHLVGESCRLAAAAMPLAGALVALHGAMVADGTPDADAGLLARLRAVLGPDRPLVATFDIHANLSEHLFELADVLIGYDTYPHTDMALRGAEAARVLASILASGARPAKALRKLPLLTVPQAQATAEAPMVEVMAELHVLEAAADVLTASVAVGFPYADVAHLGVSVVVYGQGQAAVEQGADRLQAALWSRRQAFAPSLVSAEVAVAEALAGAPAGPVVLVDVADNVGGGAPGDGTVLLEALLAAGAAGSVVVLWAPAAAAACLAAGVGARFRGRVGGSDGRHGPPVELDGVIELAAPVTYRRQSSYMTGQLVDLGQVGIVNALGVRVVLTSRRAMPFDADHLRVLGLDPAAARILVCKSAIGWRAAFGEVATKAIFVATPGVCTSDLTQILYTKGQRKLFPLEPEVGLDG